MSYTEAPYQRITDVSWATGGVFKCISRVYSQTHSGSSEPFTFGPCGPIATHTTGEFPYDPYTYYAFVASASVEGTDPGELQAIDLINYKYTGQSSGEVFDPGAWSPSWTFQCDQSDPPVYFPTKTGQWYTNPTYERCDVGTLECWDFPSYIVYTHRVTGGLRLEFWINNAAGSPYVHNFQLNEFIDLEPTTPTIA